MKKEKKILAYLRVSTDLQDVQSQELEIRRFCDSNQLKIHSFIKVVVSAKKEPLERKISELITTLATGNYTTLIVTELSRLSRTIGEMFYLLEKLEKELNVEVIATKDAELNNLPPQFKLMRRMFVAYFAEEERRLISLRTKEALASRKQSGIKLGKPLGSIQKSIYDSKKEEITYLLSKKIPLSNIVKIIGFGKPLSLGTYIKRRKFNAIEEKSK